MFAKDKPLLKRRTFWKGVLVGMLLTAAIVVGTAAVLIANEPQLVSYAGVQPTFEPEFCEDTKLVSITPTDLDSGEWCDPRFAEFKDCVPFYDDHIPPGYSTPYGPRGFLPYHPRPPPMEFHTPPPTATGAMILRRTVFQRKAEPYILRARFYFFSRHF